jgi:uncharacterized protein YcbK (DUF882 family)
MSSSTSTDVHAASLRCAHNVHMTSVVMLSADSDCQVPGISLAHLQKLNLKVKGAGVSTGSKQCALKIGQ